MNLYQIDEEILKCIDTDTGEVVDAEKLNELQMDRDKKIRNIVLWMKNLKSDIPALKAERDAFAGRVKATENKLKSLNDYLTSYLQGQAVRTTEFAVSFRRTMSSNILNEQAIPQAYLVTQPPKIDKATLLRDLKLGVEVPGAELLEKVSMIIK